MRTIHVVNALMVALLFGFSIYVYPELPERIPQHFGADGMPDRWADRSMLTWLLLPLSGAGTALILYLVGSMVPTNPKLINMPDRKKLLELPPQLQQWVLKDVATMLYVMAYLLLAMFLLLQYGAYRIAMTGAGSGAMIAGIVIGVAGTPIATIVMIVRMQRRMDAAWREYRTKGAAAAVPG